LALLIGFKLGGVVGVVISVPIATALDEIVNDLTKKGEKGEQGNEGN